MLENAIQHTKLCILYQTLKQNCYIGKNHNFSDEEVRLRMVKHFPQGQC